MTGPMLSVSEDNMRLSPEGSRFGVDGLEGIHINELEAEGCGDRSYVL